ncbi:guanine nucleotide exchange factor SPIKE 1 [Solanum stenotomum]|uniref:guanine nucleotide exchange factor SPIKE 1 n=1 Tax=Solanum stenotomum TaxID=172797 RepID=UPI0020D1E487|nr:guanine nucleotide exchange factor SPIKE 1 [Solanum stenotomum]
METSSSGYRFRRIPHHSFAGSLNLDPLLDENLEQWPHLNELVQCYRTDWVKDENKYGHYESVSPTSFQSQIYEGPDTDIETEMHLANARRSKIEDSIDGEIPSTSGTQLSEDNFSDLSNAKVSKHFGESPLPTYEPVFDWENERSLIFGQRIPEAHMSQYTSGLKIAVKVLSLSFQAGLVEPFYGTICLYNRERREKLSEDFIFHVLPTEMQEASSSYERRCIFHLDAPSASICLLIQLEKPATEEGGVSPSVYSRKEPVHLTEREKQKLQVWSRIMPYRESFSWAIIPLFDSNIASVGGSASPSSPLAPSVSASSSQEGITEPLSKITADGKLGYSNGNSIVVEVSNLNKVKEGYTEESLQDPKRKVHKPVKGVLKLEIEKLPASSTEVENALESGSLIYDSLDHGDHLNDSTSMKCPTNGSFSKSKSSEMKELVRNGSVTHENVENTADDFEAFDFRTTTRNEPFLQLFHCLYVYPLTVSMSRKRNMFIRVELRRDDTDIRKPSLEAMHPKEPGVPLQKWSHTQVAVGARVASYHDEIKVSLPVIWTPSHHLLFTFYHVDLQTKLEAPKPVVIGYASLPLSTHAQFRSEISLPIMKELVPHYLQESGKERLDYLEDGKNIFKLRLRLCSSLYPVSERIRDFFLEYDRHTLRTSPPWGSELLEAINSLKNVDSTALLQFLYPILNMLLHLIGNGGETLQVAAFRAMVNILTRVQQESVDEAERNAFLVNFVDYAFDDFGGRQPPVYPGLSTVWGSLARSKAKGYRVGPVYDDVLAMAWFFLELIVKSMALEQARSFYHNLPSGEDIPPMQLKEGVFRCVVQLYDCLLTEVHERCKKGLSLAKHLNSSLAFFCYDLLSIIEPRQVFELVSLYLDKFSGVCQTVLHDCKLTFLQIICDHDLFVEMPGRDPSDRNYLSSILIQEIFLTWDHDDLSMRAKAARILVVLMCKHEFDIRYQKLEDKLYIAQLYFPLVGQVRIYLQALVCRNDGVWSKDHVSALRKICPMVSSDITSEASAAEVEGYGASKLTVDSAVKYLQLANKLFHQAELFHFCASILELVIPVNKSRKAYGQLAKCHTTLTNIYESILEQESSPIPFTDATYYRVGFYGEKFGNLDRKEYVYREPRDVRLGDIMEKLSHIYESRMDGTTLHVIPDSRQVKADELQPGVCYLQITAVDPVMEDEDLGSRRERIFSLSTGSVRARVFDRFLFDTPFTKNGKTQGGLEDQWKRRTVLQTEGSFPALVNRLLVIKCESLEFSPVENAIGMIETRTAALRNELEEPRSSEGDQLPRLQSLQRILQGSVAVQVNSGVLSVCTAFLSGEPATRLRSQELQQLIAALLEFMAVCKRAIRVHFRLIGEEDQDFHTQLVNGFQSLTAELSHYIPAILSEL